MKSLINEILELKRERNAVILAHNYVDGALQDVADYVGDSLELSIRARDAKAERLVFCGVRFMAETAKLLSPQSQVYLPESSAGCPMADMANIDEIRAYKAANPDTVLVAYVNTTAATKAEVDICCTSANAEKVVNSIPKDRKIMFLPDQNLGLNVSKSTGRELDVWNGCCPIHHQILAADVAKAREAHPNAELIVHPECPPEIVALADHALSTGGMLREIANSTCSEYIIGTEYGIIHRMQKENPCKKFFALEPLPCCADMKKLTLENLRDTLRDLSGEISLDRSIIERARQPIDRMLAL